MSLKSFALCLTSVFALGSATPPGALATPSLDQSYDRVTQGDSSYIFLFAFPSAAYLDWSSPSKLAWTSLQSTLAKRTFALPTTIGHAQFAWHCQKPDGTVLTSGGSGQSGERNGQSLQVLKDGWGMSLLELVYTDGILESTEDVKDRVRKGAAKDQFSWVAFQVPTESCVAMADYVDAFKAAGAHENYGFPVDPLKLEGGGCTSFAHAAVVKAGLPLPFEEDWLREYRIAPGDMGRGEEIPAFTTVVPQAKIPKTPTYVGLPGLLWGNRTWDQSGGGVPFRYYDPELFYESFLHLENAYRQAHQLPQRQALRTSTADNYQQKIKASTTQWVSELQAEKVPMRLDTIEGKSGLVIDLRPEMID
jgi:hypothetical protein